MSRKPSQADRLKKLLSDGNPHSTPEILTVVYGTGHSGIARIGARIADLKARGCEITSWADKDNKTVWWYQMTVKPKPKVEYVNIGGVMHAKIISPEI